jgi:hypothetical protein
MFSSEEQHLLFVEPQGRPSSVPVIDALTRKMAGAWSVRTVQEPGWRGLHPCTGERCYATSDNYDSFVVTVDGARLMTNSLCVHYLAFHRAEVPERELAKVARLAGDGGEPTSEQLDGSR